MYLIINRLELFFLKAGINFVWSAIINMPRFILHFFRYQTWQQLALGLCMTSILTGLSSQSIAYEEGQSFDHFIIVGYGRAGRAMLARMDEHLRPNSQVNVSIIDNDPQKTEQCHSDVTVLKNTLLSVQCHNNIEQLDQNTWKNADIIMEFIPEDLNIKRKTYHQIINKLSDHSNAVIFSNTSSYSATELTETLPDVMKSRLVVNHLYLHHGDAAELGGIDQSSDVMQSVQKVAAFNQALAINSYHLIKGNITGHAFNRVWFQIKTHFISMMPYADHQIMNEAAADLVFKIVSGRPLGIFSTLNHIGLETSVNIWRHWLEKKETPYTIPIWYEHIAHHSKQTQSTVFHEDTSLANQKDEQWLYEHSTVNLENAIAFAKSRNLYDENWEKIIAPIAKNSPYLEKDIGLKFTSYLLLTLSQREYLHIINIGVMEKNQLDDLINQLIPNPLFLTFMQTHAAF